MFVYALLTGVLLPLVTAGFKYVFGIIFLHPYMVGGMATAFAIWASSWVNTFPERPAVDTDDANKQRVKHERYQLKGIAHLAFCIKVITDLGQWAGADKLSTGELVCTLSGA